MATKKEANMASFSYEIQRKGRRLYVCIVREAGYKYVLKLVSSFLLDQPYRLDGTWQQFDSSVPERQPNGEGVVLGALYLHRQGIKGQV